MKFKLFIAGVAAAVATASAAQAGVTVTYEAPGVTNTTAGFDVVGVETFDGRSTGTAGFSSDFGGNGVITGVYNSATQVKSGDQYGGQGGSNYAVTFDSVGYSLSLSSTQNPAGVTYFGYYLPALDGGNLLELYSGDSKIFSFSQANVLAAIGGNSAYFGNPEGPYQGQNSGEPYVFVNFFATEGTSFDRVVFRETPAGGGYESDNHTVGYYKDITGTPVSAVPEPATWAMMIIGFGGVGAMVRQGRRGRTFQVA
jgi:hypothetical protein